MGPDIGNKSNAALGQQGGRNPASVGAAVWSHDRGPVWMLPLAVYILFSTVAGLLLYKLTGGHEIADDARHLQDLVRHPFVLWGNYQAAGLSPAWGSFPPLFPLLFGLLVGPWLQALPDFLGIRFGILSWSIIVYFLVYIMAARTFGFPSRMIRWILWVYVLLPSMWGSVVMIPQEEIYVCIFCLGLFLAAHHLKWTLVLLLSVLTVLAGKYFLLVLLVPFAFYSPRPVKYLLVWGGACGLILAAYIGYHSALYQLRPILDHVITPSASLSVWALAWNLGYQPAPEAIKLASLVTVAAAVLPACYAARRVRLPLLHICVITLYLTLLLLSITVPAYVLWVVPMMLFCLALIPSRAERIQAVALAVMWGIGEWGANFFRGVLLALEIERPAGKTLIATTTERLLGPDFPFLGAQVVCIGLVLVSGFLMIGLIWRSGRRLSEFSNPHHMKYPAASG